MMRTLRGCARLQRPATVIVSAVQQYQVLHHAQQYSCTQYETAPVLCSRLCVAAVAGSMSSLASHDTLRRHQPPTPTGAQNEYVRSRRNMNHLS